MKKILASLMAIAIGTTAATSVVACGQKAPSHTLDVKIGGNLKYNNEYTDSENLQAYNGGSQSAYQGLSPLNTLLYYVWNIFSMDKSQFVNPGKISEWRKTNIGLDSEEIEGNVGKPSIDGIYFNRLDPAPIDFYKYYQKTAINSLGGLYQLYTAMEGQDSSQIGAGAKASYDMIKPIFDSPIGQSFINSFLSLNNQTANSSWLSATFTSDTKYTELDSKVLPFNIKKAGTDENPINEYQFKQSDNPEVKYIGDSNTEFIDVNTKRKDEEGHDDDKMGNQYKSPFNLLMLPTTANVVGSQAQFDPSLDYPVLPENPTEEEKEEYQEKIDQLDGNKNWEIRTPANPGSGDLWRVQVDPNKSGSEKEQGYIKNNVSVIVPLAPIQIAFTYSTDTRNEKAVKYTVNITLEGLQAVFKLLPARVSQTTEDDKDTIANRYVKWQFTNYQFTNQVDVLTPPWKDLKDQAGFGNFSGMKISKVTVDEL